jgi:hypothetical protein
VFVVVVEPHLTGGDHAWMAQPLPQPLRQLGVPTLRVVRVDAGGRGESLLAGGEGERAIGGFRRLTDDDDVGDAGRPGALEDDRAVGVVGRVGEMAVGVAQQAGRVACVILSGAKEP